MTQLYGRWADHHCRSTCKASTVTRLKLPVNHSVAWGIHAGFVLLSPGSNRVSIEDTPQCKLVVSQLFSAYRELGFNSMDV